VTAQNRHLTTEQLSAYLDKALTTEEQEQCETHLQTCERCQQKLASLRQTAALLHALPQPPLPRSFLLSEDMLSATSTKPVMPRSNGAMLRALPERRAVHGWSQATLTALRSLTALAAVFGLVFLLSSISFPGGVMNGASMSTATSSGGSSQPPEPQPSQQASSLTPQYSATHTTQTAKTPQATPTRPPAYTSSTSPSTGSSSAQPTPWLDLSNPGVRALLGLLLLFLALLGLLLLRRQRQMTRAG
jgi:anti-sigma factor RsiW